MIIIGDDNDTNGNINDDAHDFDDYLFYDDKENCCFESLHSSSKAFIY